MALDQHKAAMLVLLDLSAAFDTIDHGMLLSRLSDIGIQDAAHNWLRFIFTQPLSVHYH